MNNLISLILAFGLFILAAFVILLFVKSKTQTAGLHKQLQSLKEEQSASLKQAIKRQQQNIAIVEQENIEQHRLIQRMDETIGELQQGMTAIDRQLQELQQRDPEVKLYQQAKQLIASGTNIDEVVESCGIPRAEAELLFSLSQQNNSKK